MKKSLRGKKVRAEMLKDLIPGNFGNSKSFIYYNWTKGITLYQHDSFEYYKDFIQYFFKNILAKSEKFKLEESLLKKFYMDKTQGRIALFLGKNGKEYFDSPHFINGNSYLSLNDILAKINYAPLLDSEGYGLFHGDLQFDNIIFNEDDNSYKFIDWRDSFADITKGGDIYYDLAKLYGGCVISYLLAKDESKLSYSEGSFNIQFVIPATSALTKTAHYLETVIVENGYDLDKVKFLTSIIFLNMSPLHEEKFSKMLWFKSIELLSKIAGK